MIKIYNNKKELIATTDKYRDMQIQSEINQIEKIKFYTDKETGGQINLEGYIETKYGMFVVKESSLSVDYIIQAQMELEDFEDIILNKRFERKTMNEMIKDLVQNKGWIVNGDSNESKTLNLNGITTLDSIFKIIDLFDSEIKFNNKDKEISISKQIGEDRGVYFHSDLNLKSVNISGDTYDYATRLIPKGKDGLGIEEVNNGLSYVENLSFTNKIITRYWIDERYTVAENLKRDAELRLSTIAKPMKYLECTISDLSKHSKYKFMDYNIGDFITLTEKDIKMKELHRISSVIRYPDNLGQSLVILENRPRNIESRNKEYDEKLEDINLDFKEQNDRLDKIEEFLGIKDGGDFSGDFDGIEWDDDGTPIGNWGDDTIYYNPNQLVKAIPSLKIGLSSWVDINHPDSVDYSTNRRVLNARDYFSKKVVYTQDEIEKRPTLVNRDNRRWLSFNPDPMILQRWRRDSGRPSDAIQQNGQFLEKIIKDGVRTIYIAYYDRTPERINVDLSSPQSQSADNAFPVGLSSPLGYPYGKSTFSESRGLSPSFNGNDIVLNRRNIQRIRNQALIGRVNNEDVEFIENLGMNKNDYNSFRSARGFTSSSNPYIYEVNAFFTGEIAEIIMYTRELDTNENSNIVDYLTNKYGIFNNVII